MTINGSQIRIFFSRYSRCQKKSRENPFYANNMLMSRSPTAKKFVWKQLSPLFYVEKKKARQAMRD